MSEVRLVGVSKRYQGVGKRALDHLDLTIESGELAVLVGPSGCGKSTTLRIVAGLEEASSGRVFIDDRDVTNVPPADRDIAMVFQSYALYPHMSVYDNLAFALRIRKQPEREIRPRVQAVADSLGISEYLDRKPKNLSGGQRQRVAIGRAVVREPKVFLFDEPLSNLDAKLRGEMRREIARIHNDTGGTSSLYVTHDQIEAMTLADRIVVLRDGEVQQVGSPVEIYDTPANRFVAGFFGTPAMNFLAAEITSSSSGSGAPYRAQSTLDTRLAARGQGFELPLGVRSIAGPDVIVGIRPESLSLEERQDAHPLEASVALREVLGAEVLLHLSCEAGELTARADSHSAAREGEQVTVWIDPEMLHVFDAETEQRL